MEFTFPDRTRDTLVRASRHSPGRLGSGGRSVEYQVKAEGTIVRIETKQGKPERRERYDIPRCGPLRLAIDKDDGREFAGLTVNLQASQLQTDPPRVLQILALVGKNKDRVTEPARAGGAKP